jgi:hypothetical protein
LCRRLGLRHIVVRQRGGRLAVERDKNARTHFCTDEHAQFVALANHLRSATRVTYDGIAGDVLSQSSYLNPEVQALWDRRDERALADYLLDGYGTATTDAALARLLAPDLLREVPRERAIARLVGEVRRHLDAPNPVASFFFWNRTRREIALSPYALLRDVTVYAPFLDVAVVELLASLPAAMLMDRRFHTDAIARAYPAFADVPYEAKSRRVLRPAWQRRFARDLTRDVIGTPLLHTRALLPRAIATLFDGDPARLWWGSLACYLAQLDTVARRV